MYAIVSTGGKQYKVAEGDIIDIEKLEAEEGQTVTFGDVLFFNDGKKAVTDPETGETSTKQVIGVYVLTAAQAEFKAVEILADDGDYYLVKAVLPDVPTDNQLKTAFRAGDQVIVSSDELYDGKVISG